MAFRCGPAPSTPHPSGSARRPRCTPPGLEGRIRRRRPPMTSSESRTARRHEGSERAPRQIRFRQGAIGTVTDQFAPVLFRQPSDHPSKHILGQFPIGACCALAVEPAADGESQGLPAPGRLNRQGRDHGVQSSGIDQLPDGGAHRGPEDARTISPWDPSYGTGRHRGPEGRCRREVAR